MKDIKAAIFDLDGTLIDSMWFWAGLDEEFFRQRGLTVPEDYGRNCSHKSTYETAVYTIEILGLSETPEELIAEWQEMALQFYSENVKLKDGVYEYLTALKGRGVKLAVATANSEKLYLPALKHCKIEDFFDVCVSADETGSGKNSPDIYNYVCKKLGAEVSETAVFEDTYVCIKTAKNAGYYTIGVYDDYSSADAETAAEEADMFIRSFRELL